MHVINPFCTSMCRLWENNLSGQDNSCFLSWSLLTLLSSPLHCFGFSFLPLFCIFCFPWVLSPTIYTLLSSLTLFYFIIVSCPFSFDFLLTSYTLAIYQSFGLTPWTHWSATNSRNFCSFFLWKKKSFLWLDQHLPLGFDSHVADACSLYIRL